MCQEKCGRCHEDLIFWLLHKDLKFHGKVCCYFISLAVFFVSAALYVSAVVVAWTLVGEYGIAGASVISLPLLTPAVLTFTPCLVLFGNDDDDDCTCGDSISGVCEAVDCSDPGDVGSSGSRSSFGCLVAILVVWFMIAIIIVTGGVVIIATTSGPTDIVPAENQTGAIVAGVLAILSSLFCAGSIFPCIYLWVSKKLKNRRNPRTSFCYDLCFNEEYL